MPDTPLRMNLCKDEPIIRDDLWEITVSNMGDFGYDGKLCVKHRQHGTWDEWPDSESDAPSPVTSRAYDLDYELTFPSQGKAMTAARNFLKKYGSGEVEWLEYDIDSQRYLVVQHTKRGIGWLFGWSDQPDPVEALLAAVV